MKPLFALLLLAPLGLLTAANSRPNVEVIMVDDMGFSDIGCYGSEIPTPHIDRLAADWVRFTQFPERVAQMTARWDAWAEAPFVNRWPGGLRTNWGAELSPALEPRS